MYNINPNVIISVDLKKKRIRIHRKTLYLLDKPKYIQLLVNPDKRCIAVRAIDTPRPEDQAEKILSYGLKTDIEFYSGSFIGKLCELIGDLDTHYTYRFTGAIIAAHRCAVFSLDTLFPVEP